MRLDRSAVILILLAYCLIHWMIRVFTAPVFTVEEASQLLFSQSLQAGYDARQPPLIAWLYWLATRTGQISPAIIFSVKYVLLFIGLSVYYLAARRILIRPGVSAAALGAWLLTFQIGWAAHEDLLGGVGLMAALSLCLHAISRILTGRWDRGWIYLGASIGLGMLTHHLFIILPASLLGAIALSPVFRGALSRQRLAIVGLIAAGLYAPYAVWLITHPETGGRLLAEYAVSWEVEPVWLERAGRAAAQLGRALLEFSLPLLLFWMTLFWTLWLPVIYPIFARRSTDEEPHELAWRRLFVQAAGIAALIYLLSVIWGQQAYRPYWMMPVLFCMPVWLFAHVSRAGEFPVAIRGFGALVAAFTLLIMGGRVIQAELGITACGEGSCRPYTPFAEWASGLRQAEFSDGTIVGADPHLTGNLRAAFPRARVLDASAPPAAYPPRRTRKACLIVWRDTTFNETRNIAVMPPELSEYLEKELGAPLRDKGARGALRRNLQRSDDRAATLYYQIIGPAGACG